MTKTRLEAFSDGVIAIVITVTVLEMKVPHRTDPAALAGVLPVFLSYVLSFVYVGIYWNNHHHMLHAVGRINGWVMWANLHLLFWLSLLPFVTGWMGENHFAALPTATYGAVLLAAALAWLLLQRSCVAADGRNSALAGALDRDLKGKISPLLYLAGVVCAFWRTWISDLLYVLVAALRFVPDRRFEKVLP
ncbi:MAG: DUF1211 domain-containing protein [Gammaproteobacteria bacterium]|nr:DUF1211 domain-containing protein [Gammaproteobacteria bacterium]